MKVDSQGNVYATGPGGVWVFSPDGKHLGTIKPAETPANCGWGDDGKTLYMTARTGAVPHQTRGGRARSRSTQMKEGDMKRRTYLEDMLAAAPASAALPAADAAHPILLHVDLTVDPAKEKEMLKNFQTIFKPAAAKQPGYIDVKILKLRSRVMGKAPAGVNYRFQLTYQSEELRQKWIASDIHQKVGPRSRTRSPRRTTPCCCSTRCSSGRRTAT